MSCALPASKAVKDVLEGLLGRDVTVAPSDPLVVADLPNTVVAVYVSDSQRLSAVLGIDLSLAAYTGAALGLVPVGGAQACLEDRALTPMLAENVTEICNILASVLNREGAPRVRLSQTFMAGDNPPADAASQLLAIGNRLDLQVGVAAYGSGQLSLSLPI
jgi:hypothetical protein